MRETISYKKNFITGEEEQSIKMKPDDTRIRGITTIQLFEGDKLVEEFKDENIITDYPKKLAYMDYFRYKLTGQTKTLQVPFNVLALSDDDREESADIFTFRGEVIGWANKVGVYSGSSTLQGSRNEAETTFSYDGEGRYVAHFVFDFPTHCANGTFKSLYWLYSFNTLAYIDTKTRITLPISDYDSYAKLFQAFKYKNTYGVANSGSSWSTGGNYLNNGGTIRVYNYTTNELLGTYSNTSSGDYIFGYDGDVLCCFIIFTASEGFTWRKYRVSDMSLLTSGTISKYTNYGTSTGIYHKGKLYLSFSGNGGNLTGAWYLVVDIATNTVEFALNGFPVGRGMSIVDDEVYIPVTGMRYFQVYRGKSLVNTDVAVPPLANNSGGAYTQVISNKGEFLKMYPGGSSTSQMSLAYGQILSENGIGAYNKLSSPVMKTSVNTMKIQYDFVIEEVNVYQ